VSFLSVAKNLVIARADCFKIIFNHNKSTSTIIPDVILNEVKDLGEELGY
jgi:hypothetical protein